MLTPQEVSTHAFTKAVMGGYNMAMVDEFLDEVTDDYTALYKENAALKAKMKVLVEKVEEYRATEDSMRATLLTAQRMADAIVKEAEAKRDEILAQAKTGAEDKLINYRRELAEAEERLRQGQVELTRFIATSREICNQQLRFLDQLPQQNVRVAAPVVEEPVVEEIEEQVMAAFAAQQVADMEAKEVEKAAVEAQSAPAEEENPFVTPLESTRRIDLDELKFGRNYGKDRVKEKAALWSRFFSERTVYGKADAYCGISLRF
jgi:cell division initiation protein